MRKWVSLFISILLLAAVLLLHHNVVNDALNTLPEAALAAASPSLSVKAFSELDVTAAVTPVMTGDGYIQTFGVTAYYTTADALSLFGLTMKYGGFEPWEDGNIMISSQLAVALFLTENALGQTVTFGGREYTVCGVYSLPASLLACVSQTTETDIFLPLESYPDQSARISEYLVGLKDVSSIADIESELEVKLGVQMSFRSEYHFDETRRLALQSEKMQWLLLALAFCALSGWWAMRLAMGLVKTLKADSYRGVLASHMREVILCITALVCFAVGVFLLGKSAFPLFLPQDFIVNKGSVVDYVIGNFQLRNMKSNVFLCSFSSNAKTVLAVLNICFAVILVKLVCQVKGMINRFLDVIWEGSS